jgi:hypothetical protein
MKSNGGTTLDSALTEIGQCLYEMQDFWHSFKKDRPLFIWIHILVYRQALTFAYRCLSEELQTVF